MNRDNVLFAVIGLLVGFIAGYLLHEVMAARQPPRNPGQQSAGGSGGPPMGTNPAMEEILRLRDYVEANPNDAEAVLRLANLNFHIQSWDRARQLFEQYLRLRPEEPDVLSDLGVCYLELGNSQRALDLFNRAQELDPNHWQSRYNEVVILAFDLRDFAAAERVIEELRRLQPGNPDVEALAAAVARQRDST